MAEHVCAEVPHRQFVFTIPKRLRLYFRYDRRLLGDLCQAAWRSVRTVYQAVSGRPDGVSGMVGAIQTFGDLIYFHPHIHALVSEGVFLPDDTFLPLPKLASEPFLKLWEQEVFGLLLAAGKITEEVVQNIGSWKHSGFSVDQSVCLETGDREAIQRLIQYFLRCPFSQARMIDVTETGKVLYKSSHPPSFFVPRTTAWQATNWADFPRPLARICWPVPSATSRFSIHWISGRSDPAYSRDG